MTSLPSLARVGDHATVVYTDSTGAGLELRMQDIGLDGAPMGSSQAVTSEIPGGSHQVLGHADGGIIVFAVLMGGVRAELRTRVFDASGTLEDPRVLVGAPDEARDPSITAFAGGYAIAYRSLLSGVGGAHRSRARRHLGEPG